MESSTRGTDPIELGHVAMDSIFRNQKVVPFTQPFPCAVAKKLAFLCRSCTVRRVTSALGSSLALDRVNEVRSPDRCERANATLLPSFRARIVICHPQGDGRRTVPDDKTPCLVASSSRKPGRDYGSADGEKGRRGGATRSASSSVRPSGQRVRRRSVTSRPRETKSAAVSRPPGSSSSSLR